MLLFGCVVAPTAAALDAAQGPVVSQASEHEGTSTALVDEDVLVFIPDDALRWEISQKYGCRDGPIHSACMARLRDIRIGPDVADLTGLEFARNLWSLSISAPRVTDLSPLRGLQNLTKLALHTAAVSDFSPLSALTSLQSLTWWGEDVSDLDPLANHLDLSDLKVWRSNVSDIEALRNLTSLRSLSLTGSQVADLEPLSGLTKLSSLELDDTPVSDLRPLARLVNLGKLVVDNARVSSLAPLADLRNLWWLSLKNAWNAYPAWEREVACDPQPSSPIPTRFNNTVSDLAPLAGSTNLTWLALDNNRVSTLTPLAELKSLGWLWLSGNDIADLAGLEGLSALRVLDLTDNAVSGLGPLSGLRLDRLYLNRNTISDLAPLAGLTRLQDLYLNDNKVTRLGPLAQVRRLRELDLGNNNISDLDELGRLLWRSLDDLYLENNGITDLSPILPHLINSRRLRIDVRHNPLDERSSQIASQRDLIFSEDDHGDIPRGATLLSSDITAEGRIDPEHDVDYFRLHVTETIGVDIQTFRTSGAPRTMLHDKSGVPRALGPLISESLEPGTHYLSVASNCLELPSALGYDLERTRADYTLRITPAANVDIPDANLRARLRDAIESRLGHAIDRVTTGGMLSLRSFEAADSGITDLRGLERATEAGGLYLPGNVISDLSPLASLPRLSNLDLARNAISDLSPLAGLTRLWRVHLSENEISDLFPLAGLRGMRMLELSSNAISDLSPLADFNNLLRLDLSGNEISDIKPLLDVEWEADAWINLRDNPLDPTAISVHIPELEDMGVTVQTQKDDHGDEWDEATWLQPGVPAFGISSQAFGWDFDYFRFQVTEPSGIHLSVTGPNPWWHKPWELQDSSGTILFRSRSGDLDLRRTNIRRRLGAGIYRILVWGSASYTVQMNIVPAPRNLQVETDGSRAKVTWETSSSAEFANHAYAYIVVAVPVNGGTEHSCWASNKAGGCVISGLSEYDEYEFTVREIDPLGADASPVSAPVVAIVESPRSFWRGWRQFLLEQSRDGDASPERSTFPERIGP